MVFSFYKMGVAGGFAPCFGGVATQSQCLLHPVTFGCFFILCISGKGCKIAPIIERCILARQIIEQRLRLFVVCDITLYFSTLK
jgi:hypothetical protein